MNRSIDFRITGLPVDPFRRFFDLGDEELALHNARRYVADAKPGFPCRVSLIDAEVGERVILVSYTHHQVNGPYSGSGPVFVRESARVAELNVNEVPEVVRHRLISVRAYDADGLMNQSQVVEGRDVSQVVQEFFANEKVQYLHLHNAKPGCYSCRVDRA